VFPDPWTVVALVYVSGVALGTILADAQPLGRIGLALVWPLGPAAFVVTVGMLLAASLIAFPAFGGAALAAAVLLWWLL
jgi:hypothetical protein